MFDTKEILTELGFDGSERVTNVTGGTDATLWRVQYKNKTFALRLFPAGRRIDTEVSLMQVAAASGLPVPAVHATLLYRDCPVMLVDWCPGAPLTHALMKQPWRVGPLGAAFGRAQAAIHRIQQPPSTEWVEWAGPGEAALKARLRSMPLQSALIHLDYHPLNVMTDGETITGVLDWTNARIGDPRADFARTYTILRVEVITPGIQPPHLTVMRWALERAWRRGYESAAGKLTDMAPFYAWAGAAMIHDWEPRVGKPGFWIQQRHLDRVRRWRDAWKRRAGL